MVKWSLMVYILIPLILMSYFSKCQDNFIFPSNTPTPKYNPNDSEFRNFLTKIGNFRSDKPLKNIDKDSNNHNER